MRKNALRVAQALGYVDATRLARDIKCAPRIDWTPIIMVTCEKYLESISWEDARRFQQNFVSTANNQTCGAR